MENRFFFFSQFQNKQSLCNVVKYCLSSCGEHCETLVQKSSRIVKKFNFLDPVHQDFIRSLFYVEESTKKYVPFLCAWCDAYRSALEFLHFFRCSVLYFSSKVNAHVLINIMSILFFYSKNLNYSYIFLKKDKLIKETINDEW